MLALTALALAGAATQIIGGVIKKNQAHSEGGKVPLTEVPDSANKALAEAQNLSLGRSAGALSAENKLKEAASTAVGRAERAATNSSQVMAAVSGAHAMESKGIRDIRSQEEGETVARKNRYIDQLYKMADLEKSVADENKSNQYNAVEGAKAAGGQMIYSGVQSGISAIAMASLAKQSDPKVPGTTPTEQEQPVIPPNPDASAVKTVDQIDPMRAQYDALVAKGGMYLSYEDWKLTQGVY